MARPLGAASTGPATGARARCWQAMRILRRFSAADLSATAEAGPANVQHYLRSLARVGYVRIVQAKREGMLGGHPIWMLVRDTGPLAPRVRRAGDIWDPNRPRPGGPPIGEVRP